MNTAIGTRSHLGKPIGSGHGDIQILAWETVCGCPNQWFMGTATFRFWHGKQSVDAQTNGLWARRHSDSGMGKSLWMPKPMVYGHGDIQILA
ncbi:MAG: hypothetical protein QNJ63_02840 [Calothrix sp. MO_192.B10]|nr:hypothetical protein [Calothrix sp. MO_192.B10]